MSIPVPPKKLVPLAAAAAEDDDSENEGTVPVLPADDDDDEDDDTNTSNDASSVDDDDAEQTDDEEDDEGADAGGPGAGAGGDNSEGEDGGGGGGDSDGEGGKSKKNLKKRRTASKKNTEDDLTLLGVPHGIHFDDDEDEDDEDDEEDEDADHDSSEYFQKLKSNVRESYIATYHPESLSHNYDEIQTLSRVVRNSAGVIVDDLHRTIPIMTKYEKTRILGQRAKQLNEGAPAFIKIDSTVIDGYLIAVKELEQKKTPFIIRRPLPNGGSEYWRIQDLEIL